MNYFHRKQKAPDMIKISPVRGLGTTTSQAWCVNAECTEHALAMNDEALEVRWSRDPCQA